MNAARPGTASVRPLSTVRLFAICAAIVLAVLWRVLWIGSHPDTLIAIRPWTRDELVHALTGYWLYPTVAPYHRPLSSLYFAGAFAVFGLNSPLLHLASLLLVAVVCTFLVRWLRAEAGVGLAVGAVAVYLTHPVLLESSVAIAVYQVHLISVIIVAATLCLWSQRRASMTLRAWWPLLLLPAIGFYIKEDTVMVLPAILVLQTIRARAVRDVPAVSREVAAAAVATAIALGVVRWLVLPEFDTANGFTGRAVLAVLRTAAYAPGKSAFAMFFDGKLLMGSTALVLALQCAGARAAWRNIASRAGWVWLCGLVLLAAFSAPLVFADPVSATRLNLTVFSAAIMLGAGAAALMQWTAGAHSRLRFAIAAAFVIGSFAQWHVQQEILQRRFASCSVGHLEANEFIGWTKTAPDLWDWLARTPEICAASGVSSPEDDLDAVRWSDSTRHVVALHRRARRVTLTFASAASETPLSISVDGQHMDRTLPPAQSTLTLPLSPSFLTWLRRGYRVDIHAMSGGDVPSLTAVRID